MRYPSFCRTAQVSLLVLALLAPAAVQAQQDLPAPNDAPTDSTTPPNKKPPKKAEDNGQIIVTGSRIRRSQVEGPAPVTVVTSEQIRKDGFSTVYDGLKTTTEALGNPHNDYDWGQAAPNASELNLRDLGPGRTLMLINGHRVADYPMPYNGQSNFANFGNLPTGMVNRIEILTGAASAIYGSDAMGGVVNVILNKDEDGQTFRLKYGGATMGGSRNLDVDLTGGLHGDRWSLVYNLQFFNRGELTAGQRPFMENEGDVMYQDWGPAARHYGTDLLNPVGGLLLLNRDTGIRVTPPQGACDQYNGEFFLQESRNYNLNTNTETHNGYYCGANYFKDWVLRVGSKDRSGYVYGNYDVTDNVKAWASVGLWHTTAGSVYGPDGFGSPTYWDPRANNGAGADLYEQRLLTAPEIGGSGVTIKDIDTSYDVSAGLNGKLFGGWDWEVMAGHAYYSNKETYPMYDQVAMKNFFLGPQLGTAANGNPIYEPDYSKLWNPLTPSQTSAFVARGLNKAYSWLNQAQAVANGTLFNGWAGPIKAAFVAEAGRQGYRLNPDIRVVDAGIPGSEYYDAEYYNPNYRTDQGGGTRNHFGAGVELNVPLLKPLIFDGAVRWDKYDAVASKAAVTYQGGLEFRPTKNVLFRANYGTSFRAPDMHYVYAKPSTYITDLTDYSHCYQAGFPNNQCPGGNGEPFHIDNATVSRQGTPNLLYETGNSKTLGVVWEPTSRISLSADYWNIDVKNLIQDIGPDQVLLDEAWCKYGFTPNLSAARPQIGPALCALEISRVHRDAAGNVTGVDVGPINQAQTRVAGIDLKASYTFPRGSLGRFTLSGNFTDMLYHASRSLPTDPLVNDISWQNPRVRANATLNWASNSDKLFGTLYVYGKSGGKNNRWGGCAPFADGYVPSPSPNGGTPCQDVDSHSPDYLQSTHILHEYRFPRIYLNGSVGYQFTRSLRFNLYVSNILNHIYRDPYCGDFAYCVDDPVGREVSAEVVAKFR